MPSVPPNHGCLEIFFWPNCTPIRSWYQVRFLPLLGYYLFLEEKCATVALLLSELKLPLTVLGSGRRAVAFEMGVWFLGFLPVIRH